MAENASRARTSEQRLAEAHESPVKTAWEILLKAMCGQLDDRRGDTQRKAALDVIAQGGPPLKGATNEQLLAEVAERGLLLRPGDLDAAEREVTGGE